MSVPVPPVPLEDAALDLLLQQVVVGITGLDGTLVRPRWQNPPPKQPEPNIDWCAIGVLSSSMVGPPSVEHFSSGTITDPSADTYERHEELEVLASFFGPNAKWNASVLRDGLYLPQNCEQLEANQIVIVEAEGERVAPDFINQQWVRRVDLAVRLRRKVQRVYSMPNLLEASVHVFDDSGDVDETISAPPS